MCYQKRSNSFEVLDEKQLIGEIKNKLNEMKHKAKKAKAKAEAKSSREILNILPPKSVVKRPQHKPAKDDVQVLLRTMMEKSEAYYSACSKRSGQKAKEYESNLRKICKQVIDDLEEYVFVEEEEDGTLTKMSNDEACRWIAKMYVSKRDYFTTEQKQSPVQQRQGRFDAQEDEKIIAFARKSITEGLSFGNIPWNMLVSEMKGRSIRQVRERAQKLLNDDGSLRSLLSNDGKEWTEEEDKILHDARSKGELDLKALSRQLDRSERMISKRLGQVTFDKDGNRITGSTVRESILDNPDRAKEYLDKAKLKPQEELSERSKVMGCQIHAYSKRNRRNGKSREYCGGINVVVMGITVTGPPLHQAAATVGSGPKPAPATVAGKKRKSEASHLCKDGGCTNPKHLKWEDHRANMHRNTCVGMIKFDVGGKIIMVPTKECTCNGQCLNYVSAM